MDVLIGLPNTVHMLQSSAAVPTHDTLPIAIAALGMPVAGGIAAILTFAISRIGRTDLAPANRDVHVTGMISLLFSCALALSVLVVNAVTSSAVVVAEFHPDWLWARWSAGLLAFAFTTLGISVVRLLVAESRTALRIISTRVPISKHINLSHRNPRQWRGVLVALCVLAILPALLGLLVSSRVGLTLASVITAPVCLAAAVSWQLFKATGFEAIYQARLNQPGIIFLVTARSGKVLMELQEPGSPWAHTWALPRREVTEDEYKDPHQVAWVKARELMQRIADTDPSDDASEFKKFRVETETATGRPEALEHYFELREVLAAPKVSVFEITNSAAQGYDDVTLLQFGELENMPDNLSWWSVKRILTYDENEDGRDAGGAADKGDPEAALVPSHMKWFAQFIKHGVNQRGWAKPTNDYWILKQPIRAWDIKPGSPPKHEHQHRAARLGPEWEGPGLPLQLGDDTSWPRGFKGDPRDLYDGKA